jgi:hypothetical protein
VTPLTDAQLAGLSHSVYGGSLVFTSAVAALGGVGIYVPETTDGICYGLAVFPGFSVIVYRGTEPTDFQNWFIDLSAFVRPSPHPTFGPVHAGGSWNMDRVKFAISKQIDFGLPVVVTGHSLGGQRAQYAAALILENYQKDPLKIRLVSIAGPAVGFKQFLDYIAPITQKVLYRNAGGLDEGDPVSLLPPFPYLNIPRVHVSNKPGNWAKDLDPILWHNSELYPAGIAALEGKQ